MATIQRKVLISVLTVILAVSVWSMRYNILYHYYLWRLESHPASAEIIDIVEEIKSIAPHIPSSLERTYEDFGAGYWSRHAAAVSLVSVDRVKAEALFLRVLQSGDKKALAMVINDLGHVKSVKAFNSVIKYKDSTDKDVRLAVVEYLGSFNDTEKVSLLKDIMNNDPEEEVRKEAAHRLHLLGAIQPPDNCD